MGGIGVAQGPDGVPRDKLQVLVGLGGASQRVGVVEARPASLQQRPVPQLQLRGAQRDQLRLKGVRHQ